MKIWILIIILAGNEYSNYTPNQSGSHVVMQEFSSRATCLRASSLMKDKFLELDFKSIITHEAVPGTGFFASNRKILNNKRTFIECIEK